MGGEIVVSQHNTEGVWLTHGCYSTTPQVAREAGDCITATSTRGWGMYHGERRDRQGRIGKPGTTLQRKNTGRSWERRGRGRTRLGGREGGKCECTGVSCLAEILEGEEMCGVCGRRWGGEW